MEYDINKSESWFAVRCLFSHPSRVIEKGRSLFEERITLWTASSWEEAFSKAKEEAIQYSSESSSIFVKATDAFKLFDSKIVEVRKCGRQCAKVA